MIIIVAAMVVVTLLFLTLLRAGKEEDKCIEQYLKEQDKQYEFRRRNNRIHEKETRAYK
jgi:hypothetical protein